MMRNLIAAALFIVLAGAAHGFGLGLGDRFGRMGAIGQAGSVTPPTGCASTGVFTLSNVCNDIYLLTGSL